MRAICLALFALSFGCAELPDPLHQPEPPAPLFHVGAAPETDLFAREIWDDGNAEVARYTARQMRYGEERAGELVLITVKESFDPERLVKADGPSHAHAIDVIKLNAVLTFQTGVYTYHQMASVYSTRPELSPIKLAVTSQEWCGTTTNLLSVRGDHALSRSFSYHGAEGERSVSFELPDDVVLEDALPLFIRAIDRNVRTRRVHVLPSQLSNHAESVTPVAVTITIRGEELLQLPMDDPLSPRPATAVEVAWPGDRRDVYYIGPLTRELLRIERAGHVYDLRFIERAPYWEMNAVADEDALLPRPVESADALPAPEELTPPDAPE